MSHPSNVSLSAAALLIAVFSLFPSPASKAASQGLPRAAFKSKARRSIVIQDPCSVLTPINFGQDTNAKLETADCRLNDGTYADFYSFYGFAGQQIAISLNSAAFDAYLYLTDGNVKLIAEDDDGGGGSNARLPPGSSFGSLPYTGIYIIVANSYDANETGDYTLKLSASSSVVTNASAASFSGALLAADSIVAAFSDNLATQTAQATTQPLPT